MKNPKLNGSSVCLNFASPFQHLQPAPNPGSQQDGAAAIPEPQLRH